MVLKKSDYSINRCDLLRTDATPDIFSDLFARNIKIASDSVSHGTIVMTDFR